jgi:hypothetical protein
MPYHTSSNLTEYVHVAVPNGKGGGIDHIPIGGEMVACLSGKCESAKVQRCGNKVDCRVSCRVSCIQRC